MEEQQRTVREFWREIRQRITDYHGIGEDKDKANIRRKAGAILRYFNMKWMADGHILDQWLDPIECCSPFPSRRTRRIIEVAANHPFFRRLQFIRQLGTTYLRQRRDASHTRWSHTIGVAECAGQFLDALDNNGYPLKNPEDESALTIGALLHDSLQGPWGHSIEMASALFVAAENVTRSVRLDKLLLSMEIDDETSELREAIAPCLRDADANLVLDKLKIILDKDACRRHHPESYYLAQILNSLVDADRLDYLARDATHTYTSTPMDFNQWQNLIQGATVVKLKDPENKNELVPLDRLAFDYEHREIVESFLTFRRDMYARIYEHPRKVIIDDMLCHALFYTMRHHKIIPSYEKDPSQREEALNMSKEVLRLVDEDLLQFVLQTVDLAEPPRQIDIRS